VGLVFSHDKTFIRVRKCPTGKILQLLEGQRMRDELRVKEKDRIEDKVQSRIPNSMQGQGVRIKHPFSDLQL